jgi:hypothetical protein
MRVALLMRELKWTWLEYCEQPQWLITMLHSLLQNEAEAMNRKTK